MARIRELSRRKERDAQGACIVEGVHAVQQAVAAGLPLEAVLVCPERIRTPEVTVWVADAHRRGLPLVELSLGQFERVTRMESPVALVAVAAWRPLPLERLPAATPGVLVIAEDLDEAGNLGSLIRTADGSGAGAVIATGAAADPAQRKCLRASLGTAFRLPVAWVERTPEALAWARQRGYHLVATSPGARDGYAQARYGHPVALIFGNERRGLEAETLRACDQLVRIPMLGSADSLNVTVAAGVLLYELQRRRAAGPRPPGTAGD